MKRLLITPFLSLITVFITGSCTSSSNNDKAENDSIAAAELEAARLDSLRQDSISRRNFTTPDLALAELHGHVKTCEWGEEVNYYNPVVYSFTNDGVLKNGIDYPVYKRNKEGEIISFQEDEYTECAYKWSDNRVSCEKFVSFEGESGYGAGDVHYFYNQDGLLSYTTTDNGVGEGGCMRNMKTVYSDYQFDEMGNWISRKATTTYQTDPFCDGSWKNHKDVDIEVRVIIYYDSEIGKDRVGLLSKLHQQKLNGYEQALEEYRSKTQNEEQEDKKGPEWINGIWEVNTTVSTAMGSMRVNAKVCIDRDSQQLVATDCGSTVARGIYRISGNSIICGDLYIDMDMSNQRLEYGSGIFYRRVSTKYL